MYAKKSPNNAFIGFLDPENMDIDTKTKSICASQTEILAKANLAYGHFGGHFEIYCYF